MFRISILFLCAILISSTAAARIYTWTDDEGVMHLSDQPPPFYQQDMGADENDRQDKARHKNIPRKRLEPPSDILPDTRLPGECLTLSGYLYATSPENLDEAIKNDDAGDSGLSNQYANPLPADRVVIVEERKFFSGYIKFRFKGESSTYWTPNEAIDCF